jgi:hypothetical protein
MTVPVTELERLDERRIVRTCSEKYDGALMRTNDSTRAGSAVATWSRTMPPPLRPIALTRVMSGDRAALVRRARIDGR